jgi:HK97 gp10 family phage protein
VAKVTFKIEGLRELDEVLQELPKATARNAVSRTLKEQGKPIADDGEARAPRLTGNLAQSYTVGTKLSRRQKKQHSKQSDVEVFIGPTPHAKSVQTEFGNRHQAPQPHLRPAWDGNVKRVLEGIRGSLANQIDKAVQRLARKAAREAAKMKT